MIRVSKILAIVILIINVANLELYIGYEWGFQQGREICKTAEFSGGVGNNILSALHLYIALFLFIFVIGKLIQKEILSQIICLSSLVLTLYFYYELWLKKRLFFNDTETFGKLVRDNIWLDWCCVFAVFGLLIYQIILIVFYFNKSKNEIK